MAAGPELGQLLEALSRERAFGRLSAAAPENLTEEQRQEVLIAAQRLRSASGTPA
jgi:hypothetical protein